MRVNDADDLQPAIDLPEDTARQRLSLAVEGNMNGTGVAMRPCRYGTDNVNLGTAAVPYEQPADLLVAASGPAMLGEFIEQRRCDISSNKIA